jgi:hypothetical protein
MKMILLSLVLLMTGVVLAFLMVIHLLEPSFILTFLAYAASLAGLALGFAAVLQLGGFRRLSRD